MLTEDTGRGDCLAQGTEHVDMRLGYLITTYLIVRPNLLVRLANRSWWAKWQCVLSVCVMNELTLNISSLKKIKVIGSHNA